MNRPIAPSLSQHPMNKKARKILSTISCIALVCGLVGGGGVAAAYADPPGSPGAGYDYGLSASSAPSSAGHPTTGGWSSGANYISYWGSEPQVASSYVLDEPSYSSGAWQFAVNYVSPNGLSYNPGHVSFAYTLVCAPTEWSLSADQYGATASSISGNLPQHPPYDDTEWTYWSPGPDSSSCPYLVSVHADVHTTTASDVDVPHTNDWTALDWANSTPYVRTPLKSTICQDAAVSNPTRTGFDCGPFADPTTVESCGTQPSFNPFDGSTYSELGPWLVYWPECWFVPKGGFDRKGLLATAWNASAAGTAQIDLNELNGLWPAPNQCGPIIPSGGVPFPMTTYRLQIDTCSWTYAAPIRIFIGLASELAFGFFAIEAILSAMRSLTGMRKSPLEGMVPEGE